MSAAPSDGNPASPALPTRDVRHGSPAGDRWRDPPSPGLPAFFLHGLGSSAEDFRRAWGRTVTGLPAIFLDGPEPDRLTSARRWYPFTARPEAMARGVAGAADFAESRIAEELNVRGLAQDAPLALVGHSQGAMVCLELLRRGALHAVYLASFAGRLAPMSPPPTPAAPADVHLFSSRADLFVRWVDVEDTAAVLREHPGLRVRHHVCRLPHQFSLDWLDPANFLETPP